MLLALAYSMFVRLAFRLMRRVPRASHHPFARWLAKQRATGWIGQSAYVDLFQNIWGALTVWCLMQSPVVILNTLDLGDLQAFHTNFERACRTRSRFSISTEDCTPSLSRCDCSQSSVAL